MQSLSQGKTAKQVEPHRSAHLSVQQVEGLEVIVQRTLTKIMALAVLVLGVTSRQRVGQVGRVVPTEAVAARDRSLVTAEMLEAAAELV